MSANTVHQGASQEPNHPRAALQGHDQEVWESHKACIYRLYMTEGMKLDDVIARMESEFGFRASSKMYTRRLKDWGFQKNKRPLGQQVACQTPETPSFRGPRTRPRRLRQQGTERRLGAAQIYPHGFSMPVPSTLQGEHEPQELVILAIRDCVVGLFESHGWSGDDSVSLHPLDQRSDQSSSWQHVSDECFAASKLIQRKEMSEGFGKLDQVCKKVKELMKVVDLTMLIKLWRILLQISRTCEGFGDFTLLRNFVGYLRELARLFYDLNHPTRRLFEALFSLSNQVRYRAQLRSVLNLGYLSTIKSIESRVSRDNTVVLHMWSNYQKTCNSNKLPDEVLMGRFQEALSNTEMTHGQVAPETIEVLHRYLYAAYYNACNKTLSYELASMLLERAVALPGMQYSPSWCLSMQGYALAAKIRANSLMESGDLIAAQSCVANASQVLMKGDEECRTRASFLKEVVQ